MTQRQFTEWGSNRTASKKAPHQRVSARGYITVAAQGGTGAVRIVFMCSLWLAVFNFDKPETKDFTETVRLLAGLSKFVIVDVTDPKPVPLELQATVLQVIVPFLPIIENGQEPFAMLEDLWKYRDWVFEPLHYSSADALMADLDGKIIQPAEIRFAELLARKAEKMKS